MTEKRLSYQVKYRVIYADTDKMGIAYHGNYLRWFEIGRSELFRSLGLTYKQIETRGNVYLPVLEAYCKYRAPAQYDDVLTIDTTLDRSVKGGMKFEYRIIGEDEQTIVAEGYTRHAFVDNQGRIVRPPGFLKELLDRFG